MDRPRAGRRGARVQLPTVGSAQHAIAVSIAPVIQLSSVRYTGSLPVYQRVHWYGTLVRDYVLTNAVIQLCPVSGSTTSVPY